MLLYSYIYIYIKPPTSNSKVLGFFRANNNNALILHNFNSGVSKNFLRGASYTIDSKTNS